MHMHAHVWHAHGLRTQDASQLTWKKMMGALKPSMEWMGDRCSYVFLSCG